jgi:hypothetical protein
MNRRIWRSGYGSLPPRPCVKQAWRCTGRIRWLHRGLPPRRVGVRIRQRSVRSSPGDCGSRELRVPSGSAFALSLVSDRDGQPTPVAAAAWFARHGGVAGVPAGLASGRPPWPRRDRPIWPGHSPRRPGTRPDMAGRQRQLVFLTRSARRYNGSGRQRVSTRSALGRRHVRAVSTQNRAAQIFRARSRMVTPLGLPGRRHREDLLENRAPTRLWTAGEHRSSIAHRRNPVPEPRHLASPSISTVNVSSL